MLRKVGISLVAAALALVFASSASAATSFDAHGSVEQVYATGLPATGAHVSLLDSSGQVVRTGNANKLGGLLFRDVSAGDGYRVRLDSTGETSDALTVMPDPLKRGGSSAPPDDIANAIYHQSIPSDGYGYLTTRDGTKLAYSVHPPTDVANVEHYPSCPSPPDGWPEGLPSECPNPPCPPDQVTGGSICPEQGGAIDAPHTGAATDNAPSPTLIEYSGYGYAKPDGPVSGIEALANLMGFTVVDVNMRGTGCSGGAFDFFESLQSLDGYDVVEAVAHQPWVAHNKVGMLGISYGGISQLFTAQTQPPDLAAIAPLSVIDQTQTTLYPGGIKNNGFAVAWAAERQHEALPADPNADPNDPYYGGQPYADQRIAEGDQTCKDDQVLHPEAADLIKKINENDHYVPEVADPVSPITFVDKINVPVFMACQFTDEQTGGHCPTLAEHMTGTDKKWFTYTNGTHVDSLDPETYNRMYDFLELYVAQENPATKAAAVRASFPAVFQAIFGINGPGGSPPVNAQLPADSIQEKPTYDTAKAAFEAQPSIRVLFDNGAGKTPTGEQNPGWPYPGFEQSFDKFPIPGTEGQSWYLGSGGGLSDQPTQGAGADQFTWDAHARPLTDFTGDTGSGENGLWTATPPYDWSQDPNGTAVSYVTQPLTKDTAVIGAGRVDLWVRSSAPDVELQATISEVRPDGKETFVQNGWVRAVARKLDPAKSTELEPVQSFRQEDFSPMPSDRFEPVTIPLYYEGHMYRPGSRIRVRISAPNGDQPIWSFGETVPAGQANIEIGHGAGMPSKLELPVVPGVTTDTPLPPCPGLRGEPCRDYQPFQNARASLPDTGSGQSPPLQQPASSSTSQPPKTKACAAKKHKKKSGCGAKKKHGKKK